MFLLLLPFFWTALLFSGAIKRIFKIDKINNWIAIGLGLLIIADILAIPFAYNKSQAFQGALYRGLTYTLVWIVASVLNRKNVGFAIGGILSFAFVAAVYGIWQFWRFWNGENPYFAFEERYDFRISGVVGSIWNVGGKEVLRPTSLLSDPNDAAGFFSVCILILICLLVYFIYRRRSKLAVMAGIVLLLTSIIFVLDFSRSGILGLAAGLIFLIFSLQRNPKLKKIATKLMIVGTIGVAVMLVVFPTPIEVFKERFLNTQNYETSTDSSRVAFAKGAVETFKKYPLTGVGVGNFEEYFITEIDSSYGAAHTHSAYLTFLAETGIIGFVANVAWMVLVIWFSVKALLSIQKENDTQKYVLMAGLTAGYIAITIGNIFYGYYPLYWIWLYTGLVVGYAILNLRISQIAFRPSLKNLIFLPSDTERGK